MLIFARVLQALLGLAFLYVGFPKLIGSKRMVEEFARFRYPRSFLTVTGLVEILGAAGFIAGIWLPGLALLAGMLMTFTMLGAVLTHVLRVQDPPAKARLPMALLLLSVVVTLIYFY